MMMIKMITEANNVNYLINFFLNEFFISTCWLGF